MADSDVEGGGQRLVYIGRSVNPEPSDQTNLNKRHRCNLGGSGGTDIEVEADTWAEGAGRPVGGVGHPLGVCCDDVASGALWNLLE